MDPRHAPQWKEPLTSCVEGSLGSGSGVARVPREGPPRPPRTGDAIDRLIVCPPSLACVAGALRAVGHEVRIVDAAVLPRWERTSPRCWRTGGRRSWASRLHPLRNRAGSGGKRRRGRDVVVILGGVHATLSPAEVVEEGLVDFACTGRESGPRWSFSRRSIERAPGRDSRDRLPGRGNAR